MNSILILIAAALFGMLLHYAKKAMYGELWRGATEPNPFKLQFWSDFYLRMFVEKIGHTMGSVIVCVGTGFVLAHNWPNIADVGPWDLIAAGVASGYIGDSFNQADPS